MRKIITTVFIVALGFISNQLYALNDIYMKLVNSSGVQINGEATAAGFVNWVKLSSTEQSNEANVTLGSTLSVSKPTTGDITFQMPLNSTFGPLANLMYTGQRLLSVDVWFVKSGCTTTCVSYKIRMENVYVSKLSQVSDGEGNTVIQVSFTPTQFAWGYFRPASTGVLPATPTTVFGWNKATNGPFSYPF